MKLYMTGKKSSDTEGERPKFWVRRAEAAADAVETARRGFVVRLGLARLPKLKASNVANLMTTGLTNVTHQITPLAEYEPDGNPNDDGVHPRVISKRFEIIESADDMIDGDEDDESEEETEEAEDEEEEDEEE